MIFPPAVSGSAAYEIEKSLRFRASGNSYLTRTPSSAGSQTTWTWAGWLKIGDFTTFRFLLDAGTSGGTETYFGFTDLNFFRFLSNGTTTVLQTNDRFRDTSAHFHLQVVWDTTNATASDRIRLYVNGSRITSFSTTNYPALNGTTPINAASEHRLGVNAAKNQYYFDGYLSDVYFIDGQALDPSSFTETVGGVLVPKNYTGSFGTNGYHLPFSNGTSLSTLTADTSGNGNNWTSSGHSLTAGANYDWMEDTPTNNFCVLNNRNAGAAAAIGKAGLSTATTAVRGTFNALAVSSYWEVAAGASNMTAGVISDAGTTNTVTVTANKVFAFRLSTAGALDYRNVTDSGAWTNITTGLSGNQYPYSATAAADWNFGQRPFSGAVPGGYAKLCSQNIPAGTITTSGTFTGNASTDGPFVFLNGIPTAMAINGNAVTFGTDADRMANGFKVRTTNASYNAAGSNTYAITTTDAAFKNARAQINP